ncbi:EamA family transporter [Paenibacillus sp. 1P07SE]|uniref:EamA family transporter n=1 Tax=Paenibacillus sp. 1P07SE TaxID=3132209 RepID=UPI0039A55E31
MYLLLVLMTVCGAVGSVLFKVFAESRQKRILLAALFCYGLGALLNIYLLAYLPYTVVMPANAMTFIWTLLLARKVFQERIGAAKLAGVACIVAGVVLLLT